MAPGRYCHDPKMLDPGGCQQSISLCPKHLQKGAQTLEVVKIYMFEVFQGGTRWRAPKAKQVCCPRKPSDMGKQVPLLAREYFDPGRGPLLVLPTTPPLPGCSPASSHGPCLFAVCCGIQDLDPVPESIRGRVAARCRGSCCCLHSRSSSCGSFLRGGGW